jgi:hypothetical protein
MFRTDRDALAREVEELRRERAELRAQNDAMRTDLLARRQQAPPAPGLLSLYKQGVAHVPPGERFALMRHGVEAFPVWAAVLLYFLTFGLFPLIHLSKLHDRLPRAERDDPSGNKAILFSFIPYFHFYWWVFNAARLADRINLQFRLRGLPDGVPRGLVIAAAVVGAIPYVNFLIGFPVLWPIAIAYFQHAANALAALPRDGDAAGRVDAAIGVRVPLVQDLPGPDEALEQQAELEAAEATKPARVASIPPG